MHSSHLLLMVSEALEKTPSLLDSAVGKLTLPYNSFDAVASPSTASYERLASASTALGCYITHQVTFTYDDHFFPLRTSSIEYVRTQYRNYLTFAISHDVGIQTIPQRLEELASSC